MLILYKCIPYTARWRASEVSRSPTADPGAGPTWGVR